MAVDNGSHVFPNGIAVIPDGSSTATFRVDRAGNVFAAGISSMGIGGSVTLTLPVTIGDAASGFDSFNLTEAAASAVSFLFLNRNYPVGVFIGAQSNVSTGQTGQALYVSYESTGAAAKTTIYGAEIDAYHSSTATLALAGALIANVASSSGSGNITQMYGMYGYVEHGSAATASLAIGLLAGVDNEAAGTITSAYSIYADVIHNTGGGTVTTAYGVYVDSQTAGSTNYAIYTNLGIVRIGGKLNSKYGSDIASANVMTFGTANVYRLTGTTAVQVITTTGWETGAVIWMMFQSAGATIANNTTATGQTQTILTASGGTYTARANSIVPLILTPTGWILSDTAA